MKRTIPIALDLAASIALALWLGGLAVLWLVLAPTVRSASVEAAVVSQRILIESLYRFSGIVESSGVALIAVQWVLRRRYEKNRLLYIVDAARTLVVFAALFCAEYGRYSLIPAMLRSGYSPGGVQSLIALAVVQAILLVSVLGIGGWLSIARAPLLAAAAAATASPAQAVSPTVGNRGVRPRKR